MLTKLLQSAAADVQHKGRLFVGQVRFAVEARMAIADKSVERFVYLVHPVKERRDSFVFFSY
jgi:hypothetical protein